jgi:ABC-type bacteriocin/lantibiotic exporter with double-glycine peptidase domain
VPNTRLASALKVRSGEGWDDWLVRAADVLGWSADRVEASTSAVGGDRDCWWVTCAPGTRERWLVVTGARGEEARASVIDGQMADDVDVQPARLASVLGIGDETAVTWVRLAPTPPLERLRSAPGGPKLEPQARLRRWLSLERKALIAVVAYSAIIGSVSLALPLAVQSLVNSLAFGRVLQPLVVIAVALLFLLSLAAALRVLEVYIVELLQRRVFADVARDVARRLPAATPEAGGKWGLTERINRFFDVVGAQKSASFLLLNATEVVMSTAAGLLVLAFYHPYLLVFDLVLLTCLAIVIFRLGAGGIDTAVHESHAKYELAAWLESIARRQRRFASPEGAAWAVRQTERLVVDWLGERSRHFRIVLRQTIGFAALQALASAGLLGLGSFLVWKGQLSLGQLVASELIITAVLAQLARFGKHVESYYDLNASTEKLGMLLDLETEPASGELLEERSEGVDLKTRRVELLGRPCTLEARPGERVVIQGMPHKARHTLSNWIYGMQMPERGNVLLDDVPVTSLAQRTRRHQIAIVSAGMPVGATLEENLTSQDARASAGQLREVLHTVGLGPLLAELPEGLQTWIHPNGEPLTRGQLVALEVARAILRNPRLMFIDHALDHVEEPALPVLWDALNGPGATWTLVVASERSEVASRCQRVYRWTDRRGLSEVSS